ncbi:Scytalone dehydratase [Penicillium subrubescens]|uniref:Scytalone dehydratase n=1 Tax=Penicillium subrubescens TaxID=1316194 RepID=A0A1Q5UL13_9EURO|nr:Scytalone dehydratase [Penicillium subrubescens]
MASIPFEDYLATNAVAFEWADSIDKKVDYSIIGQQCFPDMKAEDFLAMMSSPTLVGDPLVRTQHLLGGARYEKVSHSEITAVHQIRAAHQRYVDIDRTTVAYQGHNYGSVKHWYKRIDGVWKLAGVQPESYWLEHDFDKIFQQ